MRSRSKNAVVMIEKGKQSSRKGKKKVPKHKSSVRNYKLCKWKHDSNRDSLSPQTHVLEKLVLTSSTIFLYQQYIFLKFPTARSEQKSFTFVISSSTSNITGFGGHEANEPFSRQNFGAMKSNRNSTYKK